VVAPEGAAIPKLEAAITSKARYLRRAYLSKAVISKKHPVSVT